MIARHKAALPRVGSELGVLLFQQARLDQLRFQKTEARRVQHPAAALHRNQLAAAGRVLSALNLARNAARFQLKAVQRVDQAGLARAGLPGERVRLSVKMVFQRLNALARPHARARLKYARAGVLPQERLGGLAVQIGFRHAYARGYPGFLRGDQHAVDQKRIRLGRRGGRHNHDFIDVRHRRAHKGVSSRPDGRQPAVLPVLAGHELHLVAHQRRQPLLADFPLRAQRIRPSLIVQHRIEPADSAQYRSPVHHLNSTFSLSCSSPSK